MRKDWKTYSNSQYAFSMQYPPLWVVDDSSENRSTFGSDVAFNGPDQLFIGVMIDATSQSLDEWQASVDQSIIASSSQIEIDGQPARELDTNEFAQHLIAVKFGGRFYILRFQDTGGVERQIISTFKFLR